MIKYGVNYKCDAVRGFGERANPYVGLESRDVCPMGTFQVPDLGENETLEAGPNRSTGGDGGRLGGAVFWFGSGLV